jgi:hypothetical protein
MFSTTHEAFGHSLCPTSTTTIIIIVLDLPLVEEHFLGFAIFMACSCLLILDTPIIILRNTKIYFPGFLAKRKCTQSVMVF